MRKQNGNLNRRPMVKPHTVGTSIIPIVSKLSETNPVEQDKNTKPENTRKIKLKDREELMSMSGKWTVLELEYVNPDHNFDKEGSLVDEFEGLKTVNVDRVSIGDFIIRKSMSRGVEEVAVIVIVNTYKEDTRGERARLGTVTYKLVACTGHQYKRPKVSSISFDSLSRGDIYRVYHRNPKESDKEIPVENEETKTEETKIKVSDMNEDVLLKGILDAVVSMQGSLDSLREDFSEILRVVKRFDKELIG